METTWIDLSLLFFPSVGSSHSSSLFISLFFGQFLSHSNFQVHSRGIRNPRVGTRSIPLCAWKSTSSAPFFFSFTFVLSRLMFCDPQTNGHENKYARKMNANCWITTCRLKQSIERIKPTNIAELEGIANVWRVMRNAHEALRYHPSFLEWCAANHNNKTGELRNVFRLGQAKEKWGGTKRGFLYQNTNIVWYFKVEFHPEFHLMP